MGLRIAKKRQEEPRDLEQLLTEMDLMSAGQLAEAKLKAANQKVSLETVIIDQSYVSETDMAKLYSRQHQFEIIDLSRVVATPEALSKFTAKIAFKLKAIPLALEEGRLTIAVASPNELQSLEKMSGLLELKFEFRFAPLSQVEQALDRYYPGEGTASPTRSPSPGLPPSDVRNASTFQKITLKEDGKTSVESLISEILEAAISLRGSDIHIEPEDSVVRIRCRIDGNLQEIGSLKIDVHPQLISRLKVLAGLDIAEKRNAQDGSFQHQMPNRLIDLRLSTLPTVRGEKAVLRVLDKSALKVRIEDLGMTTQMLQVTRRILDAPHGLILVSGPTGSGKTTTVYSMLNHVNSIESNIITVEDPVEFQFGLINQVQVNIRAGLTFASVLKNILRQDPDIIMVGEIRDKETAELAIRAAITGHLVISTIHTNDSLNTVSRLMDMGIEPFMIASALVGVFSQRLVRTLCPACKKPRELSSGELATISPAFGSVNESTIYEAAGCVKCFNYGYLGRHPIYELLAPTAALKKSIAANRPPDELQLILNENGFRTMRDDGIDRVLKGHTSLDEVLKATV